MDVKMLVNVFPCFGLLVAVVCLSGCSSAFRPWSPRHVSAYSRMPQPVTLHQAAVQMVQEDPTDPARWVEFGRTCILCNDPGRAAKAFNHALELDGSYAPAYEHLAATYWTAGNRDKAVETFRLARARELESSLLWQVYGHCLADLQAYDPALQAFRKAESLAEEDAARVSALLGRAAVHRIQGEYAQAEAAIKAAIAIDPEVQEILLVNRADET